MIIIFKSKKQSYFLFLFFFLFFTSKMFSVLSIISTKEVTTILYCNCANLMISSNIQNFFNYFKPFLSFYYKYNTIHIDIINQLQ